LPVAPGEGTSPGAPDRSVRREVGALIGYLSHLRMHDTQDFCYETLTWAAALSQVSEQIMLVAITHKGINHPIVAAKEAVTAAHAAAGRFGMGHARGRAGRHGSARRCK
jgi:alkanesulfonate monooxygenase SsuD/methylene tetrahydromethanopterin reductase-like flavin-dependent oxidoreductase (luciferase family)